MPRLLRFALPSALVGVVCAALNMGMAGPLGAAREDRTVAAGVTHLVIDLPAPGLLAAPSPPATPTALIKRTELLGGLMASPPVVERIARRAGIPAERIGAYFRSTTSVPVSLAEPASERRASQIAAAKRPYQIEIQARQTAPVLDVYTQAPSVPEALRLGASAAGGLSEFLQAQARAEGVQGGAPDRVRQLGPAQAGTSGEPVAIIGILTFVLAFALTWAAISGFGAWRRRAAAGATRKEPEPADLTPPPAPPAGLSSFALGRSAVRRAGDWPRTNRLLPWTLAVFIGVLWLVPFDTVELDVSFPIDLKFDRLILPIVIATWLLAVLAGGRYAPRIRLTWTHAAIGAFIACAFLSVVLSAHALNRGGELDLSIKKLPLLIFYASLFFMMASGVRRTEVPAFLKYTVALAVVCSIGLIWEYRFQTNLFVDISGKVLPGPFSVESADATALDSLGRRVVRGPAQVSLEAVTMLSLALAIALVGFLDVKETAHRALYGLAVCVILAATFATFRKSAILAPVSIILTLLYLRREQLIRLAPVGLVLIVMVQVLSPGALSSTTEQFFRSDRTAVTTVSDRTADYDAIRPDFWTNPVLGRGFGSYNHETYRILDSEILHRSVETGVVGLLLFLLIPIAVIAGARATIRSRHPQRAPVAVIGAATGVCFIVTSTLYDVLSFPHATYIFLYVSGLVAVTVAHQDEEHPSGGAAVPAGTPPEPASAGGPPGASAARRREPVLHA